MSSTATEDSEETVVERLIKIEVEAYVEVYWLMLVIVTEKLPTKEVPAATDSKAPYVEMEMADLREMDSPVPTSIESVPPGRTML